MPETDGTLNTAESSAAAVDFAGDVPGLGNRAEYSPATDGAAVETLNGPQRAKKEQGRYGVNMDAAMGEDEPVADAPPAEATPEAQAPPTEQENAQQEATENETADTRFDKHPRFQELRAEAQAAKEEAAQAHAEMQRFNQWRQQQEAQAQVQADEQVLAQYAQQVREDAAAELGLDPDDPDPTVQSLLDRTVRSESALKKIELAQERSEAAAAQLEYRRVTDETIRELRAEFPITDHTFSVMVKGADEPITGSIADIAQMFTQTVPTENRPFVMRSLVAIINDAVDRGRRDERTAYAAELAQKARTAGPSVTRAGGSETPNQPHVAPQKPASRFFNAPLKLD